jgi:hypothetical protein
VTALCRFEYKARPLSQGFVGACFVDGTRPVSAAPSSADDLCPPTPPVVCKDCVIDCGKRCQTLAPLKIRAGGQRNCPRVLPAYLTAASSFARPPGKRPGHSGRFAPIGTRSFRARNDISNKRPNVRRGNHDDLNLNDSNDLE